MSNRGVRLLVAVVVPILALVVGHWYDYTVLNDLQTKSNETFDMTGYLNGLAIANLLEATGVAAILLTAWWSRNLVIAGAYALAGLFLALLPALLVAFGLRAGATSGTGFNRFVSEQYFQGVGAGVTGMNMAFGGAMLIAAAAIVAAALFGPRRERIAAPAGQLGS